MPILHYSGDWSETALALARDLVPFGTDSTGWPYEVVGTSYDPDTDTTTVRLEPYDIERYAVWTERNAREAHEQAQHPAGGRAGAGGAAGGC